MNWQQELAAGFTSVKVLCNYLKISPDKLLLTPDFSLRVPRQFVDRIEKGNLNDPILMQILPVSDEIIETAGYNQDPVGDLGAMTETGVIHKYQGRVLYILSGSCAINCRYCFRRNFPYADFQLSKKKLAQAVQYIQNHPDISEVILSGGDPLLLNDKQLFDLIYQLEDISHIKRIRIHSRIPIVLPSRITTDFCDGLLKIKKHCVLVLHSNHANELGDAVKMACKQIKACNITLLNQSVLLKGINDNAQQLCNLSEKLFDFGVLPYYLHQLDKAVGTGHFEVEEERGLQLMAQIKKQLPGYLVPKFVREQAGAANKIVLA